MTAPDQVGSQGQRDMGWTYVRQPRLAVINKVIYD
jgi:hypothetical protein